MFGAGYFGAAYFGRGYFGPAQSLRVVGGIRGRRDAALQAALTRVSAETSARAVAMAAERDRALAGDRDGPCQKVRRAVPSAVRAEARVQMRGNRQGTRGRR